VWQRLGRYGNISQADHQIGLRANEANATVNQTTSNLGEQIESNSRSTHSDQAVNEVYEARLVLSMNARVQHQKPEEIVKDPVD
jgi:hypothetical protein